MEDSGSSDPDGSFRLSGFLTPERTIVLNASDKRSVLNSLIELLAKTPQITSKAELADGIFRREALMSTGIGLGIAIPHVRLASVTGMVMAASLVPGGISDYESLDNQPVRLVVMPEFRTQSRLLSGRTLPLHQCIRTFPRTDFAGSLISKFLYY